MSITRNTKQNYVLILGSLLAWFAILLQLYLIIANRTTSLPETVIRFFSFFTIQNNIIVAIYFSVLLLRREGKLFTFLAKPAVATAITVYIFIVCLVYQIVLRPLWSPEGAQYVADELLHSVIPALAFLHWLLFVNKKEVAYSAFFSWLIYPLLYFIYTLIRGHFANYYPYPFVDVGQLGLQTVLINSGILLLIFSAISLLFIFIGKRIPSPSK